MKIIELLQKYSGHNPETCEAQLAKRDGKFWFALHDLLKPTNKEELVAQLYAATQAEELYDLLSKLERVYRCSDFSDAFMKVFNEDPELLDVHTAHDTDVLNDFEPSPQEVNRYAELLRSFVPKVADKARKVVAKIRAKHFTPEITPLFKKWMTGTNEYMIKEVFGTIYVQPDKIDLFIEELTFNLQPEREAFHFTALRILDSEGARNYPQLADQLNMIARSRDMTVGMIANDLLVKYGVTTEENREADDKKFREAQVTAMHKRVNKLKTAKGLHNFANTFDWDEDLEFMFAVIRHEKCEAATAKMVYWRLGPTYFQKYSSAEEVEDINRDAFRLMEEIEQNMADKKYPEGKLAYDPKNDFFKDRTKSDIPENEIKRPIPELMY